MESFFEKLQSNIGNLWSCFRKIWPFNRKKAVKLSPEMEAFQETHKLAMDFATIIVGLTDFVIRVATAQCGYYTDIVCEILKKEEKALEFDVESSQHREGNYKKRDSYYTKTKYHVFKSAYSEFRESLKALLLIKQSIRITQNLYDGKNLAEELEALNAAFQEFYIEEIDIRRLAKKLDMEAEDIPFCEMLSRNETENYRKQIWDAKMQWVYVDFLPSSEYDARLRRISSNRFSDPEVVEKLIAVNSTFRRRIYLLFYAPSRGI